MKKLILTLALSLSATTAFACEMNPKTGQPIPHQHAKAVKEIHACYAWVRLTPAAVPITAAYLHVHNTSGVADRLLSATSTISQRVELHETKQENGVAQMRALDNGIDLPNEAHIEMKPGGIHIMLMGLNEPLVEGKKVPITLNFAKSKPIVVEALVMKSAAPMKHDMEHKH